MLFKFKYKISNILMKILFLLLLFPNIVFSANILVSSSTLDSGSGSLESSSGDLIRLSIGQSCIISVF